MSDIIVILGGYRVPVERAITDLFVKYRNTVFEDGMESVFSRDLVSAIQQAGNVAIAVIAGCIDTETGGAEVASEALRWIGYMEHEDTHEARLCLLEKCLGSKRWKVVDGAVLGLSSLGDPRAIPALEVAIEVESCGVTKRNMRQVVDDLQEGVE